MNFHKDLIKVDLLYFYLVGVLSDLEIVFIRKKKNEIKH
jgi:hypothetical protein